MLNKLNSLRNREEGFTLIELLIVVIIIGILAAIALPIFINQQKVAVEASVKSDGRNTGTNVNNWLVEHRGEAFNNSSFTSKGGKIAQSNADTQITVKGSVDGTYLVCAYNKGASTSSTKANTWGFDASTGKFSQNAPGCADTFGIDYANGFDSTANPSTNAPYAFTDFRAAHYSAAGETRYGYPVITLTPTAVGYASAPMARITGSGDWSSTFDYLSTIVPDTTSVESGYYVPSSTLQNVKLTVDGTTYTSTNVRMIVGYYAFKSGYYPSNYGFPLPALQGKDAIAVQIVLRDGATLFPSDAVKQAFYDHGKISFDFKPNVNGFSANDFVTKTYNVQNGF